MIDRQTTRQEADKVIRENEKLVEIVLRKLMACQVVPPGTSEADLDDLRQHGRLGMYRAWQMFEPERGFKFSTYAVWRIESHMRNALAFRRVDVFLGVFPLDPKHTPDVCEIDPVEALDAHRMLRVRAKACGQVFRRVRRVLDGLPERDAAMMRRAYGLGVPKAVSLADIGREHGLTRERIRKIGANFLKAAGLTKEELPTLLEARELLISTGYMHRTTDGL